MITTENKGVLLRYSGKNVSLKKVCGHFDINYSAAYSHLQRKGLSYKGIGIVWTDEMIKQLKAEFPVRFNRELAKDLGVSMRSVIRKARELGVEKEPEFHNKNQKRITELAVSSNHYTPVPPSENFLKHSFKKGEPNPHRHKIDMKAIKEKRRETIRKERLRIKYGLPRLTKLNLRP